MKSTMPVSQAVSGLLQEPTVDVTGKCSMRYIANLVFRCVGIIERLVYDDGVYSTGSA